MSFPGKVLLLVLGLFVGLAFVEVLPRALAGLMPTNVRRLERVYAGRGKWEEMMVADPDLGYRPKPGLDMRYPSEGRSIVVRTTSYDLGDIGFRDLETKPPFDAIALGDSFTFCDDVPIETCWVRLLGEQTSLSIASLGISGFSTLAESRVLKRYGKELRPRLVLLGLFPNDFNDNLRFDDWVNSGDPDFWQWRKAREGRGVIRGWLASHSISYRLVDAALRAREGKTYNYDKNGLSLVLRTDRWTSDAKQQAERLRGWHLMQRALLDMHKEADAVGARLVVVLIPSKEEVYWDAVRNDVPIAADEIDRPLGLVADFAKEKGISVCDLRPAFETQAEKYHQLYLRVSGHWNDAGNELAAQTISTCLRSQGLLSEAPRGNSDPVGGSR